MQIRFIVLVLVSTQISHCGGTDDEAGSRQPRQLNFQNPAPTSGTETPPPENNPDPDPDPDPDTTPPTPTPKKWIFGGMYSNAGYNNPVTGAQTCLAQYQAIRVFGQDYVDFSIYVCVREVDEGAYEPYEFGGIFGMGQGNYRYNNPVTNAHSCPAGFAQHTVLGRAAIDWPVHFCMKQRLANEASFDFPIKGFFGIAAGLRYPNPLVNPEPLEAQFQRCPENTEAVRVYGSDPASGFSGDNHIYACVAR